jgi:hypothetical protein
MLEWCVKGDGASLPRRRVEEKTPLQRAVYPWAHATPGDNGKGYVGDLRLVARERLPGCAGLVGSRRPRKLPTDAAQSV